MKHTSQSGRNVNEIIRSDMTAENKLTVPTRNQQGIEVIDYFNPSSGQGVREIKETGKFDTFINYTPPAAQSVPK